MPHTHKWSPIADLPADWQRLRDPDLVPLAETWLEYRAELERKDVFRKFTERLRRQWSIETGVLEQLYTLSESATKNLIEQGLDAALISDRDTDRSPSLVFDLISDQHHAVEGLYDFVRGQRVLSKSYIRELHQIITAHQPFVDARDTLGNFVKRDLIRGDWKRQPNHIEFEDGTRFEFCPPEHVESEMERLLNMHAAHDEWRVAPEVEAAWLHHCFTLIHPFQDGNGRVARCLATLITLKAYWLPLVITNADKARYIAALRVADNGDLMNHSLFFGELLRTAIRRALDLSDEISRNEVALSQALSTTESLILKLGHELDRKRGGAKDTADALFATARSRTGDLAKELDRLVKKGNRMFSAFSDSAPMCDDRSTYHRYQIAQGATQLGYYANFEVYRAWCRIGIAMDSIRTEILLSLHGHGRDSRGVMASICLVYQRIQNDESVTLTSPTEFKGQIGDIIPSVREPFLFSYREERRSTIDRFNRWLEEALLNSIKLWRPQI